jgi:hypothetical protein
VSTGYLISLAAVVVVLLGSRFVLKALPLSRYATTMTGPDLAAASLGVVGLGFHCGAMFFRAQAESMTGADTAIRSINALGRASIVWYVVAAVLLVYGLRHQHPVVLALIAVALATVGITMYDHGALATHLTAIFASVVLLAAVSAALVRSPWSRTATSTGP